MPKTTPSPFAALAQPKVPASKKATIPVIQAPESIHEDMAAWIAADEAIKNAEVTKASAASSIITVAEQARVAASTEKGENIASVRLEAGESVLTITTKCVYSAVDPESMPLLKKAFGKRCDEFFAATEKIEVKAGADLNALVALVGAERLKDFFTVTQTIKPTAAFHDARSTEPTVAAAAAPLMGTVIVPAKPSVAPYRS